MKMKSVSMLLFVVSCSVLSVLTVVTLFLQRGATIPWPDTGSLVTTVSTVNTPYPYYDPRVLRDLTHKQLLENNATNPVAKELISCRSENFLVIVVSSSPGNHRQRNDIRSSWGSSFSLKGLSPEAVDKLEGYTSVVKVVFLLGKSTDGGVQTLMEAEAQKYGDIVFGNFVEHYRNLTMKTLLGLKWAHYHCSSLFFLKTDDDVFINSNLLVKWLLAQPSEKFYTGFCNFGSKPVRKQANKWYVSMEDFPGDTYPGYCLGGGYVMSSDVLANVVKLSYGRKLFPMEDLYVGLMVKDLGDVPATDNRRKFNLVFSGVRDLCDFNYLILAHPVNSRRLVEMTERAQQAQRTCP